MEVINFAEQQTVVNRYMSELRDVCIQKDRARFRRNLERIGEVMAYEISKTLDYSVKDIQTPLGTAPTLLYNDPIVLGTIFRAGLPFHQGFLNVFEEATTHSCRPTASTKTKNATKWAYISNIWPRRT